MVTILVGIGGSTCSGKTSLAKYLKYVLPNSSLIHFDDFYIIHEDYDFNPKVIENEFERIGPSFDLDDFVNSVFSAYSTGVVPHNPTVPRDEFFGNPKCKTVYNQLIDDLRDHYQDKLKNVNFVIVEGYLIFSETLLARYPKYLESLCIKIFLTVDYYTLQVRRKVRKFNVDRNIPTFFHEAIWPRYLENHEYLLPAIYPYIDPEGHVPYGIARAHQDPYPAKLTLDYEARKLFRKNLYFFDSVALDLENVLKNTLEILAVHTIKPCKEQEPRLNVKIAGQ